MIGSSNVDRRSIDVNRNKSLQDRPKTWKEKKRGKIMKNEGQRNRILWSHCSIAEKSNEKFFRLPSALHFDCLSAYGRPK